MSFEQQIARAACQAEEGVLGGRVGPTPAPFRKKELETTRARPLSLRRALAGHDGAQRGALDAARGAARRPVRAAAGPDRRRQHARDGRRAARARQPAGRRRRGRRAARARARDRLHRRAPEHARRAAAAVERVRQVDGLGRRRGRRRRPALAGVPARARHGHLGARGLGLGRAARERPARLGAPQGAPRARHRVGRQHEAAGVCAPRPHAPRAKPVLLARRGARSPPPDARARRAPLTRPLVARLALSRALPNRSASCARRATTR